MMFSEKDLVERSAEEMQREIDDLLAESERLKSEHETAFQRVEELRRESVETRPENPELAEVLWQEAEKLHEEGRENLRLSLEKRLRAGELKHRLKIRAQIESIDVYEDVWQKASKAGRQ
jgi:hypothetical protein